MAFPASTASLATVLFEMQSLANSMKAQAQNALTFAATNNIDSNFVFAFMDRFYALGSALNTWKATPGLNTFATSGALPGYAGNLVNDTDAIINAGLGVISWVVGAFPKDAQGFAQAYTLQADGSRTAASFTPAQTVGLQSALTTFIATIG